jgi:glutaredoxin 3
MAQKKSMKVEVYSSMWCGFCHRAKALLNAKAVSFTEYDVDGNPAGRRQMMERGGGRTVPQIFVDDTPIGGCDELYALEQAGRLDGMLGLGKANDGEHNGEHKGADGD